MTEQGDLFGELAPPVQPRHLERLQKVQEGLPAGLFLGTTSWTNEDWEDLVYPPGAASGDYIGHYARAFKAVEIDSTWYGTPSARTVDVWLDRTPDRFVFAAKVPRVISHEKRLVDCAAEMEAFLAVMGRMGRRLGPLLMQFEYIARGRDPEEHESGADFIGRLAAFLPQVPTDQFRFAVEVRNAKWLRPELVDLLRAHNVGLALTSYYTMPQIYELPWGLDPVTADFFYVRFLGDRRRMDQHVDELIAAGKKKRHWDELVWDRQDQLRRWVQKLRRLGKDRPGAESYVFFNNHYAGYAPGSLGMFARFWKEDEVLEG